MPRSIAAELCTPRRIGLAVAALALQFAVEATAQIPDQFTNLQVLPKEIAKGDLVTTMKSFTHALGVRCEHCHSYRAGVDPMEAKFSDFDFPSDAREAKVRAREMLRMVRAINADYLGKLTGGATVQVRCITCHRGVVEPETIDERVERMLKDESLETALADYRQVREEFLQSGSYDFDDGPLSSLGERLLRGGKAEEAKALLLLNAEFHPDSAWTQLLLGEALLANGERDAARAAFTKSLELDPDNPPATKRLAELAEPAPKPADPKSRG